MKLTGTNCSIGLIVAHKGGFWNIVWQSLLTIAGNVSLVNIYWNVFPNQDYVAG